MTTYSTSGLADLQDSPRYVDKRRGPVHERTCDVYGAKFVTCYSRKLRCSWECQEQAGRTWTRDAARRKAAGRVQP